VTTTSRPEVWLRGPLPGVPAELMPAAHGLLQAAEEIQRAAAELTLDELWATPGGAASVGFHLRHIPGSIDRLLSYARGEQLSEAQRAALAAEREAGSPPADAATLLRGAVGAIERAVDVLRRTPPDTLSAPRAVGRAALPSTVAGLLFHIADHTQRHAGQVVTTAKIVQGLGLGRVGGG
jgi:hypothetical protein